MVASVKSGLSGSRLNEFKGVAGENLTLGQPVKLGDDGKIYGAKFDKGSVLLSTLAPKYTNQKTTYQTVETDLNEFISVGFTYGSRRQIFAYGLQSNNDSLFRVGNSVLIWDKNVDGMPISHDMVKVTDGSAIISVGQNVNTDLVNVQTLQFDGAAVTAQPRQVSSPTNGGQETNYPRLAVIGVNSGDSNLIDCYFVGRTANIPASYIISSFNFDLTAQDVIGFTPNRFFGFTATNRAENTGVEILGDGFGCFFTQPLNDSSGFHELTFFSASNALINTIVLDNTRVFSGSRPIGVKAKDSLNFIAAAVSGFEFSKDKTGFPGVTNPVETQTEVLSIYAIQAVDNTYATVNIGIPLKIDPTFFDETNGFQDIEILREGDRFFIFYGGIVHTVDVDFTTLTVTFVSSVNKRHDQTFFAQNDFSGTFIGQGISAFSETSNGDLIYSEDSKSGGAVSILKKSFLISGQQMPVGLTGGNCNENDVCQVFTSPVLQTSTAIGFNAGNIFLSGEDEVKSLDGRNSAKLIGEFFEADLNFQTPLKFIDLTPFGFTQDTISAKKSVLLVGDEQILNELIFLAGDGFVVDLLIVRNLTTPTNTPDCVIAIDGVRTDFNFNESRQSGGDLIFASQSRGIFANKSVEVLAANKNGVATSESIEIEISVRGV